MPRLAILWHLSAVPPGPHSFEAIAQRVKHATGASGKFGFTGYAGGFEMLSVFEANQVKAELSRQGVNLRTFAHNLSDHDIERAIASDLLGFALGCSATERIGRPSVVLIVPDPTAYLGQIEIIGWDELLRFAHPSPLPASLPPGLPLPLPANVAPAEPTTSGVPGPNAGEDDWEKELDELLKGMSVQAPCPENVESQPLPTPEQSPELSRSRGLIWDLDDDDGADVHRRKAATVGTTEWQTRLDQASPPHLSSWYSHDVNGGGWDDALSAIARQANSPPAPPTPNSTFSRLINAQQQIGSPALNSSAPAPAGVSGPASSDWLDTLLSETASLAASESRSSVPPASSATTSASPSPGSPWITVTRGIKGPAAYEEEKERLFAPLVEAIKLASEQAGGVRRVTRGVVGSELGATAKQKTKFYQGLPPGIDSFKDYTRAAEKAGVVILRNTGDRDGTIEIAPVRQHAKARSLLPPGLAGREVPGLGVSWKAAGKIARGGAR